MTDANLKKLLTYLKNYLDVGVFDFRKPSDQHYYFYLLIDELKQSGNIPAYESVREALVTAFPEADETMNGFEERWEHWVEMLRFLRGENLLDRGIYKRFS